MQRRIVLSLLLGLALVAAVVLLLVTPDAPPPGAPPLAPTPAAPPAARDGEPRAPAAAPSAPLPVAPAGAPRVRVEVASLERYVPPSPRRVVAHTADGIELPTELLAGAGAGFDALPHSAGAALVRIDLGPTRIVRQVALTGSGEARVTPGARLVVQGKVTDAAQNVIPGATVWFGELDAAGGRLEVAVDETGAFTAEVPAGPGVPFVARAPGRATATRVVAIAAPVGPCDAVLDAACALDVQLAGAAVAMDQARVFVVPAATVATAVAAWPFFLQAVGDGYPVDANGRATIDDLPASGDVGVVVRHPLAALRAPVPVSLRGPRARAVVPIEFAANVWRGAVVDDAGQPLGGVALWSRAGGGALTPGNSQRLLPPHLDERGTFAGRTDAAGAFTIAARSEPAAVLSLRRAGSAGRDVRAGELRDGAVLVLPAWVGGEPELRLAPPRAGTPWVVDTDLSGGLRDVLAAEQTWRVSLPHAGRFRVVLTTTVDDRPHGEQTLPEVHVTGPIELSSPWRP